ncbi:MAG TPA: amino acid adenylation domain-containing protein, partial [Pyrinomonadaceae bacterium]
LLATQLLSRIREGFKVELPLRVLFEAPTIAQLAAQVEAAMREQVGVESKPLVPVSREQHLPLSFAQQRLWFLSELEPTSSFYNMPAAVRLSGYLETDVLRRALNEIIRRHESLRTSFPTTDGQPRQAIAAALELGLEVHDLSQLPEDEREAEALRLATQEARHPFDLAQGPLFRVSLLRLQAEEHILLFTMHHIISDGWSMSVLVREVGELYRAFSEDMPSPLEELPVQYADFAVWQREWLRGEVLERHLTYWKQQLGGELPVLNLLTDKVRPQVQTFNGASESIRISASLMDSLNKLCRHEGATLFMVLLASFKILLSRYTGQTDIVVGSPIANRNRLEIEKLIGFFVNTLVLRTELAGDVSFREAVRRVRAVTLEAYAHQDMPFEQLVEQMQPERSMSRNPLFQVMFQMENTPKEALPLPGLKLSSVEVEHVTSQFDLSLDVMERGDGLFVVAEYSTDLFHAETIAALLRHWEVLLRGIVSNPDSRISELPLLSESEGERLPVEQNQTAKQYPQAASTHALFEAQAARTPEAVAIVSEDERLSFAQLNERANRLAHYLRAAGVGTETPVGVLLERSAETIVVLLAILKAGGAFVPLDPAYPAQRLAFMLEDTRMPLVVTTEKLKTKLPAFRGQVICTDESRELVEQQSAANPRAFVTAQNLAYVIYTSGSTGQPKGVSISHGSLVNHSFAVAESYSIGAQDRILQFASISFDVAVEEIFPTLLHGATVVFRNERILESSRMLALIEQEQLTLLNLPAPFWNEWVRELALLEPALPPSLRLVVVGSDRVSMDAFAAWRRLYPNINLINAYGTSETTITSTLYQTETGESEAVPATSVPIGRPLANTQVYLLNEALQPVPHGVPGELYIGGSALARGYLNRPALTAEKFIPDPFHASPGARMYRTGDRARYLADGQLEFLGRLDQQVKLRGYRIEPGEIEARLKLHPSIREAVVVPHALASGDKQLIAYVTQNPVAAASLDKSEVAKMEEEQLAQWQMVHDDEVFNQTQALADPEFNISGWNSSYTGLPIPAEEMREWVEDAVERILNERPRRVLEIGCGTGLLLFRLAPHCEAYLGTDFSPAALKYVQQQLSAREEKLPQVSLLERRADDFRELEAHAFDMVILNSVAQYFPGIEYLLNVLEGAIGSVSPGGSIFIGDVRSLPLLEAFHATVELHNADPSLSLEQLRRRIRSRVIEEEELVLDPAFFMALRERFPNISYVEIMPRRGRYHNELTQFRYQVMLHVGDKRPSADSLDWLDWKEKHPGLEQIRSLLKGEAPESLGIRGITNARVAHAAHALELLDEGRDGGASVPATVGELRERLRHMETEGLDPQELWSLSDELPYRVEIDWTEHAAPGSFDVLFRRHTAVAEPPLERAEAFCFPRQTESHRDWSDYANNPLRGKFARQVAPQLREFLREQLPDYMIPSGFVLLDGLPLTPGGKVDLRALPSPDSARRENSQPFVAPVKPLEKSLAEVWTAVLGIAQAGLHDNFFESGGHSLLATQLISRLRELFQVEIQLRQLFEHPTIAGIARAIEQAQASETQLQEQTIVPVARAARRLNRASLPRATKQ